MYLEPEHKELLVTLAAQFGGVTVATMALTEYLPFMRLTGIGPPYGKRITSAVYSIGLSIIAFELGIVKIPALAHGSIALQLVVVATLGLISMALAHSAHAINKTRKAGKEEEL